MSFYSLAHGINPATFFILPMIGKHPNEYPRFRDCFVKDNNICILTRTGGGNRDEYTKENEKIRVMSDFIKDYDDEFDNTYAIWVFSIPEQWKDDFKKLIKNDFSHISDQYKKKIQECFPALVASFK